jgi:N utilization substance protein B
MSSSARLKPRTQAVRILYEISQTNHDLEHVLHRHLSAPIINEQADEDPQFTVKPAQKEFVRTLVTLAVQHRLNLDAMISDLAPNKPLEEMPLLQRIVLHIAISEIRYLDNEYRGEIPVIINAAVEIAKVYVGDEAGRFVNGILGMVALRYPDKTA